MKTLRLFNAVIAKGPEGEPPFISEEGFVIGSGALWAKDRILGYYQKEKLNGQELNKTFHKSWSKIKNSSRFDLFMEQIRHYISTYGSNFQDEIYIPAEVLNVPEVKLAYKVINAYTAEEMVEKCLSLLKSGIALKEETINDLLSVLVDELGYIFKGNEGIKNKEAIIKIADLYGVFPSNTMDFLRYIIYRATGQALLIKSPEVIRAIEKANFNPSVHFSSFGLEKLAEVFNRFKPLFLAFKPQCGKTINRISKLSKKYHKPLVSNPLNKVTNILLNNQDNHWLENATPFALFKAISACYSRMNGQDAFVYRIRNGKSFTKGYGLQIDQMSTESAKKKNLPENNNVALVCAQNYKFLLEYIKVRFVLEGKKVFFPDNVNFALPTSEKMFVGNIPTGTRFYGEKLAVGVYWEDAWGARDLDLSGLNIGGKIGWNELYCQNQGELLYSGDITSAPEGAVEYLYANEGLKQPTLVMNNVFSGNDNSEYKIIIGKGDDVSQDYMMNPNNLFAEIKCSSVQKQTVLGMIMPQEPDQCFVLLNFGAGHSHVSGNSLVSDMATNALFQQWNNPLSFNDIVLALGAEIVENSEEADYDFSLDSLAKDSFLKIFD